MGTRNQPDSEQPSPTVVLRGGPLDGETHALTDHRFLLNITRDGVTYRYEPTSHWDEERPTLLVFKYVETV